MNLGANYPRNTALAILLGGKPGGGKCHGKGTPILMYDGTIKAVEKIELGDQLMGDDSQPRIVTSLASGTDTLYRITPLRGGESFVVNASHVMVLQNSPCSRWKERLLHDIPLNEFWKLLPSIQAKLKLVRSGVVTFQPHQGGSIDPYFLGLWLGDGDSAKPAITTPDPEITAYLHRFAKTWQLQVKEYKYPTTKATIYNLTSKVWDNQLKESMFALSLIENKHIPSVYLNGDVETRKSLLAGLLDSDGHLKNGTYEITQKREALARQIAYIARSLGYSVSIKPKKGQIASIGFVGDYWKVTIVGVSEADLPMLVERKKAKKRQMNKDWRVSGFRVTELGIGAYYGFTLTGNGRYLLGDFTITHNTNLCMEFPNPWFADLDQNLKNAVDRHLGKPFTYDCPLHDVNEKQEVTKAYGEHERWGRMEQLIKAAGPSPKVGTIVIDGLGWAADYLRGYLCHVGGQAENVLTVGGIKVMNRSLWGPFSDHLKRLVILCRSFNKPFIMTTHLDAGSDELTGMKEMQVLLQGALKSDFPKLFTDFWMCVAQPSSAPKHQPYGVRYYVRTAPTSQITLKQSCGLPAEFEHDAPEFKKLIEALTPPTATAVEAPK